jgi:hypothetical protein
MLKPNLWPDLASGSKLVAILWGAIRAYTSCTTSGDEYAKCYGVAGIAGSKGSMVTFPATLQNSCDRTPDGSVPSVSKESLWLLAL